MSLVPLASTIVPRPLRAVRKFRFSATLHRRLATALIFSTLLKLGSHEAKAATKTYDGGTAGTGTAIDTAVNWVNDVLPGTSDEALLDNSVLTTLPAQLTTNAALTFGDLIWNSNNSSTISLISGTTSRNIALSGGGGGSQEAALGGATADLLLMGTAATSSTLTIGGNAANGTGLLTLSVAKAGNIDVANAGATLKLTAPISGAVALTKTGAGTLVLGGANSFGGSGVRFTISTGTVQMSGSGTLGAPSSDLTVNANLDLNGTNPTVDDLIGSSAGRIFNNGTGTSTLTLGYDFGGATFSGIISDSTNGSGGVVAVTKIGTGVAQFASAQTYSGDTTVNVSYTGIFAGQGTLTLNSSGGAVPNSKVVLNGSSLNANSAATSSLTRASALSLNNGIVTFSGNATGNTVETITNAISFTAGRSVISIAPSTKNDLISAASFNRSIGATALIRGTSLGVNPIASATASSSNIMLATAPTLSGSGAANTSTVGILPWAIGDNSASGNGTDFLTYDSMNGLRRLTTNEYITTFASGNATPDNAKISATIGPLSGSTTLNSLTLGTSSRIYGAGTLAVSSGGILATDNSIIGAYQPGTLAFGSAEGDLTAILNKTLTIGSSISGSGGVTAGGAGTVVLAGANTYTGGTYLPAGTLNVSGDSALGAPGTPLTITGGTLQAGASSVTLSSGRSISTAAPFINATFDTNGNALNIGSPITGVGGLVKTGLGTLTLSGASSFTGPTFTTRGTLNVTGTLPSTTNFIINGGEARLDFTSGATTTNIVNSAAPLSLNIGPTNTAGVNTLTIQGNGGAANVQTFASTNYANFASHLNLTAGAGGTLVVNLGAITRNTPSTFASTTSNPPGATIDFSIPTGVTVNATSAPTFNGILYGATVNGTTWATLASGSIAGLSSYITTTGTASSNVDVTTDGNNLTADVNSLRFNTAAPITLNVPTGTVRQVTSGGYLVTSNVGANLTQISGGIIQGINRRDIIFIQNNTAGALQISSVITDQGGAGTDGITKSGAGTLILTAPSNTLGGVALVNEGTIITTGDYVAPVTRTGTVSAGTLNQITLNDVSTIFVGEKVTDAAVLNAPSTTTWVVTAINGNTVTISSNASGAVTNDPNFIFSGGGGLGVGTSPQSIAPGATLQIGNGGTTGSLFPATAAAFVDNGTVVFNRSDAVTYSGLITGIGGFTNAGPTNSTLTLTAANTYTGATVVNGGGTLIAGNTTAFGVNSAVTVGSGSDLQVAGKSVSLGSLAGSGMIENASATSATLTFGSDNTSTNFAGILADGTGGGTLILTKTGTGNQTLSGPNTSTGTLSINNGAVSISGSFKGVITVGNTAGSTGILNILPGAALSSHVTTLASALAPGNAGASAGGVYQSGGSVTFDGQIVFGAGGNNSSGFYQLSGGSIQDDSSQGNTNKRFRVAGSTTNSTGVFYQSGGAVTLSGTGPSLEVSGNGGGPVNNDTGVAYLTGGTFTAATQNHIGYDAALTTGSLRGEETIAGSAAVTINNSTILGQSTADVGILNLNGGTFATTRLQKGNSGTGYVAFNGGKLQAAASANTGSFFSGLTLATVYSGGGTIDTNGQSITLGQSLLAPTGSGITSIPVVDGGTGFVGAPYISISGANNNATAVANMIDDGTGNGTYKIASITITSPGTDYTSGTTASVVGGGGIGAILGTVGTAANTSGGLVKTGAGTLTLTGSSTYTGPTEVGVGTLVLTGSLSGGLLVDNATTLASTTTGSATGSLTVAGGGTLSPGGASTIGTLSTGAATFAAGSTFKLEINSTAGTTDKLTTSGPLALSLGNDTLLTIADLAAGSASASYLFLTYSGSWNGGLFTYGGNVIPDDSALTVGSKSYTLDYNYGGNSVALLPVPEPQALLSFALGMGTLAGLRRFRRRAQS